MELSVFRRNVSQEMSRYPVQIYGEFIPVAISLENFDRSQSNDLISYVSIVIGAIGATVLVVGSVCLYLRKWKTLIPWQTRQVEQQFVQFQKEEYTECNTSDEATNSA